MLIKTQIVTVYLIVIITQSMAQIKIIPPMLTRANNQSREFKS